MRIFYLFLFITFILYSKDLIKVQPVLVQETALEELDTPEVFYVSTISEEEIKEANHDNLGELLKFNGNLNVSDLGSNGRNVRVDLRGFGESAISNFLVLVNGMRLTSSDLQDVDWQFIPLSTIKEIRIIKGGWGAVKYGDNAVAGIINIITYKGLKKDKKITLKTGSFYTFESIIQTENYFNNILYTAYINAKSSKGYRDNSGTTVLHAGLGLCKEFSNNTHSNFNLDMKYDKSGMPGALFESDLLVKKPTETKYEDDYAKLKSFHFHNLTEFKNSGLSLNTFYVLKDSNAQYQNIETQANSHMFQLEPSIDSRFDFLGEHKLRFSAPYQYSKFKTQSSLVRESNNKRQTFALSIEDKWSFKKDMYSTAGYRYEKVKYSFTSLSKTYFEKAFYLGFRKKFTKELFIDLSTYTNYRFPLLDELYNYLNATVDENLKPQNAQGLDLQIVFYHSNNFKMALNTFFLQTHKEIFYNPLTYKNENMNAWNERRGVELELRRRIYPLRVGLNIGAIDSEIKTGEFKGKQVPQVPFFKSSAYGVYFFNKDFSSRIEFLYVGNKRYGGDYYNEHGWQKAHEIINLKFNYNKAKRYKLFLNLNNITNKEYSDYALVAYNASTSKTEKAYYPSPKFNFIAGLEISTDYFFVANMH